MYQCLERLGKAPSWDSIASKLRALDNHALAEHIDSTYIHPSLEPPSESSSSNSEQSGAGIPDSVDQTSRAPEVMIPPEVSKQYSSLSRRLTKLCLCFKMHYNHPMKTSTMFNTLSNVTVICPTLQETKQLGKMCFTDWTRSAASLMILMF